MENENSNEEPLIKDNEKPVKKDVNKDKRMSVLKQLDNKKLYPVQERVGIYIIAALSAIGLVLIGYTGVMAITSNTPPVADAPAVDAEEVYELLDEIDLEEDAVEEDESEDEDFESNHEYIEPEDEEPEDEVDPEPEEDEDENGTVTSAPTTATINTDGSGFRRDLIAGEVIVSLNEGDVVDIIDLESNQYWSQVAYNSSEFGRIEGFIAREFLDY